MFSDFLDDYFAECDEHLMGVRRLLLALEVSVGRAAINRTVLDELFRHFHSLKGISGMVELRAAENLAHGMEEYLRVLRQGDATLTAEGVDTLFDGTQMLEQVIGARRSGAVSPSVDPVTRRIARLVSPSATGASRAPSAADPALLSLPVPRWRCTFAPSAHLVARGVRVDTVRKRLSSAGEILEAVPRVTADGAIAFEFVLAAELDDVVSAAWRADGIAIESIVDEAPAEEVPPAARESAGAAESELAPSGSVAPSHFVRVDLTRLDELMRNVGDLVISRARLADTLARVEKRIPAGEWRAIQELTVDRDRVLLHGTPLHSGHVRLDARQRLDRVAALEQRCRERVVSLCLCIHC
jgi:two-component system chemotaxis sensor kinase CheA